MVRMTFRNRKRLLWMLIVALGASIIGCVCFVVFMPLGIQVAEPETNNTGSTETGSESVVEPLSAYAVVYKRDLRKPLFDPKPVSVRKPSVRKPRLGLKLLGTAVDPAYTYGFFRDRSGQTKLVQVGQTLDGAEVIAITDGSATVRYHDEIIVLEVAKKGDKQ